MLDGIDQSNNDRHVQPLNIGSKLVGGEFLFVGDVEVEIARHGMRHLFDVVYLLGSMLLARYVSALPQTLQARATDALSLNKSYLIKTSNKEP